MPADLTLLYLGLATLLALWIATVAAGWRALQRARERSREINDQIVAIHRRLDRQQQDSERQQRDSERRSHRQAQLDRLSHAEREVQLAQARGDLPAASTIKLLGHVQDLKEALLVSEAEA